jgi:hypothetical protein
MNGRAARAVQRHPKAVSLAQSESVLYRYREGGEVSNMTTQEECVVPKWVPSSLRRSYLSIARTLGEEEAASLIRARKRRALMEAPRFGAAPTRQEDSSKIGNNS